ncbi:esterase/lipase family protein [uncultured Sphingomonas sp.]|uniref:esterase/lipase family protein n=1 Tax=uncultured Sphingomonas sp. TaxID=158754 RepID=UPI0035CAEE2D
MPPARGGVVLLHGHGRRGASLGRLARAAARQGYATLVPRYRHRRSMRAILDEVAPQVEAFAAEIERPVHFITHSLGGLVARALIARGASPTGRLVMLGPPNAGSEWADLLLALRLDRLVLGAIGAHLRTTRAPADEALLGASTDGVGIIAGTHALDPLFPRLLLPGPNDGKVTVAATRLDGADHLELPVSHTLMVYDREVARQAMWFLERGFFDREAKPTAGR